MEIKDKLQSLLELTLATFQKILLTSDNEKNKIEVGKAIIAVTVEKPQGKVDNRNDNASEHLAAILAKNSKAIKLNKN